MPASHPLLPLPHTPVGDRRRLRLDSFRVGISLLTAAGLGLGGCASQAPLRPADWPVDVPATWSNDAASPFRPADTGAAWWQQFDDALLTRLVEQALLHNTSVQSAQAALRQARALRDASAAGLWPTVGSSASAQRNQVGQSDASNSFNVGLDASWELDVFGANRAALAGSQASARASAATLGAVKVSLAAEVALSYLTLRGAQSQLAIARSNLALQQDTLQLTNWRLQAGLLSSLEAEQARSATEQTLALIPPLQTSIAQAGHALAVLTGQAPAALAAVLAADAAVPQVAHDLALSLPADTLRQRPDVRAAEYQVEAERARLSQAEAARLPGFTLSGSLGLSALTLGSLTQGSSVVSALLAGVTMPVFNGGALDAQVRAQQAVLDQATQTWRATVLTALQEVEDALVALRGDRERLLRLGRAADAASNAALMARQRYGSGLVDFQTVLDTQRTQLSTEDSLATATVSVSTDHVRLYKALGGGWTAARVNDADAMAAPLFQDTAHRTDPS